MEVRGGSELPHRSLAGRGGTRAAPPHTSTSRAVVERESALAAIGLELEPAAETQIKGGGLSSTS